MTVPHLYLLKCPKSIINYFNKMNIGFSILTNISDMPTSNYIVISTWNPEVREHWVETIHLLRRKAKFNPLIILSFQKEKDLLTEVDDFCEGVFFLRLPFCYEEISKVFGSLQNIDKDKLILQQQLTLRKYIYAIWAKLDHGGELELINSILVPIRSTLLLPFEAKKKKELLINIAERINSKYWNSEEMLELRESLNQLIPQSDFELQLKKIVVDIDSLLTGIEKYKGESDDIQLIAFIDSIAKDISKVTSNTTKALYDG